MLAKELVAKVRKLLEYVDRWSDPAAIDLRDLAELSREIGRLQQDARGWEITATQRLRKIEKLGESINVGREQLGELQAAYAQNDVYLADVRGRLRKCEGKLKGVRDELVMVLSQPNHRPSKLPKKHFVEIEDDAQ